VEIVTITIDLIENPTVKGALKTTIGSPAQAIDTALNVAQAPDKYREASVSAYSFGISAIGGVLGTFFGAPLGGMVGMAIGGRLGADIGGNIYDSIKD